MYSQVRRDSMSDSLLSRPIILDMDAWVRVCRMIHDASLNIGPTTSVDITLPLLAQLYVAMFSASITMCSICAISASKIWIWAVQVTISKSLFFRSLTRLFLMSNLWSVIFTTGSLHTNHWCCGIRHTITVPSIGSSVTLLYDGGQGWISRSCVGLCPRDLIKCIHRFSL